MGKPKYPATTVVIDPKLKEAVKQIMKVTEDERTFSALISDLLENWIDNS